MSASPEVLDPERSQTATPTGNRKRSRDEFTQEHTPPNSSPKQQQQQQQPTVEGASQLLHQRQAQAQAPPIPIPVQASSSAKGDRGDQNPASQGRAPPSTPESSGAATKADDILEPVEGYDWEAFMIRFQAELDYSKSEDAELNEEYRRWDWVHELWFTKRSEAERLRISRELATMQRWTQLKEVELETARESHGRSMLAISKVLGLQPKN